MAEKKNPFVNEDDLTRRCDYEGSDYQQAFWVEGGRAYEDACEEIALRRMVPADGKMMLEVGAGAGRNTPRFANYDKVVVTDYSRTQVQQAKDFLGEDERFVFVACDVYKMPFVDGAFDGVSMIRVLHHMVDGRLAFGKIREVLRPGGVFILEFANKQNLKAILRWLLGRQEWSPFDLAPVEFSEMHFDFHPKTVRAWLKEVGFEMKQVLTVSHFRVGFLKRLVPTKLLAGLDGLMQWTGGLWQLSPSVFTKNVAVGETAVAEEGALFCCPECRSSDLMETDEHVACGGCGLKWPKYDGIYDFKEPMQKNA